MAFSSTSFCVVVLWARGDLVERLAEAHDVPVERRLIPRILAEAPAPRRRPCRCGTLTGYAASPSPTGGVRAARSSGLSASMSLGVHPAACATSASGVPGGTATSSGLDRRIERHVREPEGREVVGDDGRREDLRHVERRLPGSVPSVRASDQKSFVL